MSLQLIKLIIKDVSSMWISLCQTSTDISGIANEFVQYVQYVYIPI